MEHALTGRSVLTEGAVLGVFLGGWLVSRRLGRTWHPAEIVFMYLVGLLFEVLTAHSWNYHHVFLVYPFDVDPDISVLFPTGWAGLIMAVAPLAERGWRAWSLVRPAARGAWLVLVSLGVGDAAETLFYRIGMIEYVPTGSGAVNFALGQVPGLPPTLVLAGYAVVLPAFVMLFRWLERGLRRDGTTG